MFQDYSTSVVVCNRICGSHVFVDTMTLDRFITNCVGQFLGVHVDDRNPDFLQDYSRPRLQNPERKIQYKVSFSD